LRSLRSYAAIIDSAPMPRGDHSRIKNQESKIARLGLVLLDWFGRNARDLPWRHTRDPYAIWVAEIMLQQTQVKTVLPYWRRWMRALPTIAALARARPERIHKLWEGLGYYNRVRNLQQAARWIVEKHDGRFPEQFEEVLALPGIGRYTAGAICSIAFNQPTPILDGNVIRVLTRIFGIAGNPKDKQVNQRLWGLAQQLVSAALAERSAAVSAAAGSRQSCLTNIPDIVPGAAAAPIRGRDGPPGRPRTSQRGVPTHDSRTRTKDKDEPDSACSSLNQSLMELGALVCTPRQPKCGGCPVARHCVARREKRIGQLPNLGRRVAVTSRRFAAFVVCREGRFLVRQRPAGAINAHLWEFPNVEVRRAQPDWRNAARRALGISSRALKRLCTVRHSITRYRISVEVFAVDGCRPAALGRAGGVWCRPTQLHRLAFTAAHRRILDEWLSPGGARLTCLERIN
jgi:A/G-specific adenine glycosylase